MHLQELLSFIFSQLETINWVNFSKFDNFHDIRPTFHIYYVICMFLEQEKFKFMQKQKITEELPSDK